MKMRPDQQTSPVCVTVCLQNSPAMRLLYGVCACADFHQSSQSSRAAADSFVAPPDFIGLPFGALLWIEKRGLFFLACWSDKSACSPVFVNSFASNLPAIVGRSRDAFTCSVDVILTNSTSKSISIDAMDWLASCNGLACVLPRGSRG